MALKPKQSISVTVRGAHSDKRVVPILFKTDLDEHRRLPRVRERLERVRAQIQLRAKSAR
jgi:hypothetical protein